MVEVAGERKEPQGPWQPDEDLAKVFREGEYESGSRANFYLSFWC